MESSPTKVSSHSDSDHSSAETDSIPSISPSDSASNYGGEKDMESNLCRLPYIAKQTTISRRLLELQVKSNQLTITFNNESTYQRDENNELVYAQRVEWIAKFIEVVNDTQKIQVDILDHHLSKHKKRECIDYIASIKQIEEWLEQVGATWARSYHQLRLYAYLLNENHLLDTEALMLDIRRMFCLLIQESFWVIEPPPKVVVLHKDFATKIATLVPRALGNIKLTGKASIIETNRFYIDSHRVAPGEFYRSPNGLLENDELTLSVAETSGALKFENLRLHLISRRDLLNCEFTSKYHLLYQIMVNIPNLDINLRCRFISDSIIVVEPHQEEAAWAFLANSMDLADKMRRYSMKNS